MEGKELLDKMLAVVRPENNDTGTLTEKEVALSRFLSERLDRLQKLALEYKSRFFLGFVFEELVRCESEYYPETEIERELERFILECLENKDNFDILKVGLWHIPDAVGFKIKNGELRVKRIVEVKLGSKLINEQQMRGHISDILKVVQEINSRPEQNLPSFISGLKIGISEELEKIIVVPLSAKIDDDKSDYFKSKGWKLTRSIFSLDEAIFVAKELFPEAGTGWLNYRQKKEDSSEAWGWEDVGEQEVLDISLSSPNGVIAYLASILCQIYDSALHRKVDQDKLMEAALIWVCTDAIFINPDLISDVIGAENMEKPVDIEPINGVELPERFQQLNKKLGKYFADPKDVKGLVAEIYALYNSFIKGKIEQMDPDLIFNQDALQFL